MAVFYVYVLTNINHTTLYIRMTNNLKRRLTQHKNVNKTGFPIQKNGIENGRLILLMD